MTKIINAYQNANSYDESKVPQFISSRVEFTVILKNLNYGKNRDNEYEVDRTTQRLKEYKRRTEEAFILNYLRKNPNITGLKTTLKG